MICALWWAFEILTLLAGMIGVSEQATQTIITTLSALVIQVPLGLSEGVCAVSGNCIGADNVALAKRFVNLVAFITAGFVILIAGIMFFSSSQIANLFTHDKDVLQITIRIIQFVAVLYVVDALQVYLCGPIRALGIQNKAANIAMGALWFFGIPLACLLAFKCDLGVMGLQLGIGGAVIL